MSIRLGVVSTYPSTPCGIATFSAALVSHLAGAGADVDVVRLVDAPEDGAPRVVHQWVADDPSGARSAATVLDGYDVVVLQHEYGIYPGPDGQDVLDLLAHVGVPVVTVLHTVLTRPSANQHRVIAGLVAGSAALVTMTSTARDRLVEGWGVDPARVAVVPHGAEDNRAPDAGEVPWRPERRATVLTWGLLSEGKGVEWALRGLVQLRGRMPLPAYLVVGQTHPRVLERDGEAYRDRLVALAHDLDLTESVRFDGRYLSGTELRAVVRRADVVLLPYDSSEQVTSGVLAEAVAAGRPVVSTRFPHAVELLSGGAGLLVPRRDPTAIADALERVLTVDGVAGEMAATAQRLADSMLWPAVARQYLGLAEGVRHRALPAAV
ncbi:glycosyltransferase [Cellulomonas iranensis]|uniref:glycosyltransferase n=1 Tax=Cellulomonas iranensis TaxID=76862 RepID=UPI000B3C41D9|nr:glycosyltransferase [Cellulomonas iranensis]